MLAIQRAGALLAALFVWAALALAAPTFPELTGRIVDAADVIPQATRAALEPRLEALETKSGIQMVVATVKSLRVRPSSPTPTNFSATGSLARPRRTTACCC